IFGATDSVKIDGTGPAVLSGLSGSISPETVSGTGWASLTFTLDTAPPKPEAPADSAVALQTITIDIQAFTDGRDLLVLQGNTLQWQHLDFAAVGMWGNLNEPTIITTSLNGTTQLDHFNWYPSWPAPLDTGQWGTGNSSVFSGLTPALPSSDMSVSLDVI